MRAAGEAVPLTFQQEFALEHWMRGNNSFVITFAVRLRGALSVATLAACLSALVRRHEALRTRIVTVGGIVCQQIDESQECVLQVLDFTADSSMGADYEARRFVESFFCERLDPRTGRIFEVRLLRLRREEHVLAVALHHLFADLAAGALFFEELWTLYRNSVRGRPSSFGDVPMQYADYALWQRDAYARRPRKSEVYWQERLAGAARVKLPVDGQLPDAKPFSVAELQVCFGSPVSSALLDLARRERVAPSMAILALYAALLARWSKQRDFIVPFEVSGRHYPAHLKVMGYLAHSLLLRLQLAGDETFIDLLRRVSREFITAFAHANVWKVAGEARELMQGALLQWTPWIPGGAAAAAAGLDPDDLLPRLEIESFPTTGLPPEGFQLPFELELVFWTAPEGIRGYGWYRADLFQPSTMQRLLADLRLLAERAIGDPHAGLISASPR